MTLRKFIRQEIKKGRVSNLNEFRTKVRRLEWAEGDEIDLKFFMEYLDYEIECVLTYPQSHSYVISLFHSAEEIRKMRQEAEYQLRDQLDEARDKLLARMHGMEENEAQDVADILSYAIDMFTDRHPEYAEEIKTLIDYRENHLEDDEE